MSISSGSDITIPINDSPPPPPSPYGNQNTCGAKSANGITGIENGAYQGVEASSLNIDPNKGSLMKSHTEIPMNDYSPGPDCSTEGTTSPGVNEAVNTELVQGMNVLDTIPHKPQSEFGPYEKFPEYFISVNQHKKFLRRGEKLNVTKDKRTGSRKWIKYLCWTLGGFLLAAIVTVAVLAAVGLIPEKSAAGTSSLRGMTTTTEIPIYSSESPSTDNIFLFSTTFEPITEKLIPISDNYVPNAADVELTFQNAEFEDDLNDPTSERFKTLAVEVEQEMKEKLENHPDVDIATSRVSAFTSGSIITKLRIGWSKFQLGEEIPDFEKIQGTVSTWKEFGNFTLRAGTTRFYKLYNSCKLANGGCSDSCAFDEGSLDFVCSCADDKQLDQDKKTCVEQSPLPSPSSEVISTDLPLIPSSHEPQVSENPSPVVPSDEPNTIPQEPIGITENPSPVLPSDEPNLIPNEPITITENPSPALPSDEPNLIPNEPITITENPSPVLPSDETNTIPQEPIGITENPSPVLPSGEPNTIPEEAIVISENPISVLPPEEPKTEESIIVTENPSPVLASEEPNRIPEIPIPVSDEPIVVTENPLPSLSSEEPQIISAEQIVVPQEQITVPEEPIVMPQEPNTVPEEPSTTSTTTTTTETPQLSIIAEPPVEEMTTQTPESENPPIPEAPSESSETGLKESIVENSSTTTTTTTTEIPTTQVASGEADVSHGNAEAMNESPVDTTVSPTGILDLLSKTFSSTLRSPVTSIEAEQTPSLSSVENVDANPLINTTSTPAVAVIATEPTIRLSSPVPQAHSHEQETGEEGITILPSVSIESEYSSEVLNTQNNSQSRKSSSRAFPEAASEEMMSSPEISPRPITHSDEFMVYSDANMTLANGNRTTNITTTTMPISNEEHVLPNNEQQHRHPEMSSYENVSGGGDSSMSVEDMSHEIRSGERKSERLVEGTQDVIPIGSNILPIREREELTTIMPVSLMNDTLVNEMIENATEDVNSEIVTPQNSTSPEGSQVVIEGSPETNQSEQSSSLNLPLPEEGPLATPDAEILIRPTTMTSPVSPTESVDQPRASVEETMSYPTILPAATQNDTIVALLEEIRSETTSANPIQPSQSQESIFSTMLPILDGNESNSNRNESQEVNASISGDLESQLAANENSSESDNELSH